jgi:hypothetical protein
MEGVQTGVNLTKEVDNKPEHLYCDVGVRGIPEQREDGQETK